MLSLRESLRVFLAGVRSPCREVGSGTDKFNDDQRFTTGEHDLRTEGGGVSRQGQHGKLVTGERDAHTWYLSQTLWCNIFQIECKKCIFNFFRGIFKVFLGVELRSKCVVCVWRCDHLKCRLRLHIVGLFSVQVTPDPVSHWAIASCGILHCVLNMELLYGIWDAVFDIWDGVFRVILVLILEWCIRNWGWCISIWDFWQSTKIICISIYICIFAFDKSICIYIIVYMC